MPKPFSRSDTVEKGKYLVDGLIKKGSYNLVLAKSGTGKSFFCFNLAVCIALGKPFLGVNTEKSKVLIIDEDQPVETSNTMLAQMLNYYEVVDTPNIITAFKEGLLLNDGSIAKAINEVNPDVVIIDSLLTVSANLNTASPDDATFFSNLPKSCNNKDITIIVIHHISIHKELDLASLATVDAGSLSMCSTVFINAVDGFFVLYNPGANRNIKKLYVRCCIKRYPVNYGIFETGMNKEDNIIYFNDLVELNSDNQPELTEREQIFMGLFMNSDGMQRNGIQVKEVYDLTGGRIPHNKDYDTAESLKTKGYIHCENIKENAKYKRNCYYITELGKLYLDSILHPKLVKEDPDVMNI
jgi:archaellum biogenesis ATPase FlaH